MAARPPPLLLVAVLLAGCVSPAALEGSAGGAVPTLACGDACGVRIDATRGGGFEPHVAMHPTDPDRVVVATRVTGRAELPFPYVLWFDVHASHDGGRSWSVTSVRYTEPLGLRGGANAQNVMGDPVLAFLPDGTLLLTGATLQYVALPAGGVMRDVRLFVTRSTDGGASFEAPVVVARSTGVVAFAAAPAPLPPLAAALLDLPDKPWLATGPDGTALLTWTRFLGAHPESPDLRADVVLSVSKDDGRSWSAPMRVAKGGSLQGSAPAVGSDGAWHVAYVDMDAQRVRVATSRDKGAAWRDADVVPGAWMPALAIDRRPEGDRLLLVSSPPVGGGREDDARQAVALTWSDDGGASWAAPLVLDEPESPGRSLPSVAVGGGVAFVTYAHARGEEASSFHAVALGPGGGRAVLTLDDSIAGPTRGLGDYVGVAAGPGGAFAVWSTTRDGREWDVVGAELTHRSGQP